MLKKINVPIALCTTTNTHRRLEGTIDDDQLPREVLLCKLQRVMLTTNLWVTASIVSGSLGEVKDILYP